jgi:hypothetical protein
MIEKLAYSREKMYFFYTLVNNIMCWLEVKRNFFSVTTRFPASSHNPKCPYSEILCQICYTRNACIWSGLGDRCPNLVFIQIIYVRPIVTFQIKPRNPKCLYLKGDTLCLPVTIF